MARMTASFGVMALVLVGCGAPSDPAGATANDVTASEGGAAAVAPAIPPPAATAPPTARAPLAVSATFDGFWTSFRRAMLAGDAAAIRRHSADVVRSNGELDDDEMLDLPARDVPPLLARLLADPSEVEADGRSLRQVLESARPGTEDPNDSPSFRRVGPLVFERTNGTWRLTQVYRGPDE